MDNRPVARILEKKFDSWTWRQSTMRASKVSNTRRLTDWRWLLVFLVTIVLYAPSVSYDFVDYDDYVHVVSNPAIHPPSWEGVWRLWHSPYRNVYIPLTYTVYAAESWLATIGNQPIRPQVFHAGSVLLHATCAALVYVVLRQLSTSPFAAMIGALFFAWHPLQVESVAWISSLSGLLSGAFGLLAIWQYVKFAQRRESTANDPSVLQTRSPRWHYLAATGALALALLAKPIAVSVPLIVAVLDVAWIKRSVRAVAWSVAPWLLMAAVLAVVTRSQQPGELLRSGAEPLERPLVAADALAFYLTKLVIPFRLTPDYGRTPAALMQSAWAFTSWLLPVGLIVLAWWLGAGRRFWGALAVFVAGVLPVLGLIPFGHQDISTVADRYVYLAMLGPTLMVGSWLTHHDEGRWRRGAVGVVAGLGIMTLVQSSHWRNSYALAKHGLAVQPESLVMHVTLAKAYERDGDSQAALESYALAAEHAPENPLAHYYYGEALSGHGRLEEAITHLRTAIRLAPTYLPAKLSLALALERAGQWSAAAELAGQLADADPTAIEPQRLKARLHFRAGRSEEALWIYDHLLRSRPDDAATLLAIARELWQRKLPELAERFAQAAKKAPPETSAQWNELAGLELQLGNNDSAIDALEQAIRLDAANVDALNNLGVIRRSQGQLGEAERLFERAVEQRPEAANFRVNLAAVLFQQGRHDRAEAQLREAIRIDPDYAEAHITLGVQLLQRGNPASAAAAFRAAVRLRPEDAALENQLGICLARLGQWNAAEQHFRRALELSPDFIEAQENLAEARRRAGPSSQGR